MEIPLTALLLQGDLIIDVESHFETNLSPHGLHQFSSLLHIGGRGEGLQGYVSADRPGLPEQEFGFIRIIGRPRCDPLGMPGAG